MKFLISFSITSADEIKNLFVTQKSFTIVKDLITSSGVSSQKFAIIDDSAKTISLFNKVNEEKVRAIKINLYLDGKKITAALLSALSKYMIEHSDDSPSEGWITLDVVLSESGAALYPVKAKSCPIPKSKKYDKQNVIVIMELNYAFCDDGTTNSRDVFADMSFYTAKTLEEFFCSPFSSLVSALSEHDLRSHLIEEITTPRISEHLKTLAGDDKCMTVLGIKSAEGSTVWLSMDKVLEYMDMTEDVFFACFDKLKDRKTEDEYCIPGLEEFPSQTVEALKIVTSGDTYYYNFMRIFDMELPCFNATKERFEQIEDLGIGI